MRRALAVALALCLAAPASAASGWMVFVRGSTYAAGQTGTSEKVLSVMIAAADALGIQYDVVSENAYKTIYATNGRLDLGINGSRTYAGQCFLNFRASGATHFAGCNPESLTKVRATGETPGAATRAGWPDIPTLFVGPSTVPSASMWANAANCTTGAGTVSAFPSNSTRYAFNLIGTPLTWKEWDTFNPIPRSSAAGILRTIVGAGYSAAGNGSGTNGNKLCAWCDSMKFATQITADTMLFWARYRSTSEPAPLFFGAINAGANGTPSIGMAIMMLSAMDSAANHQLIGAKPGWRPKKSAFYIAGALAHTGSSYRITASAPGEMQTHFTWCATDSCDSLNQKAGIDSVAALDVPVTIGVNCSPDTLSRYANEIAWWKRITRARFSPESWKGVNSTATNPLESGLGNAGDSAPVDIFGALRSRVLVSAARLGGTACASGDTTMSCLLTNAKGYLRPYFPNQLSRTLCAPNFDFIPSNFTAQSMPSPDTLGAACLLAGYDTMLMNPDDTNSNPAMQYARSAGGAFAPPNGLKAFGWGERDYLIHSDIVYGRFPPNDVSTTNSHPLGRFKVRATRGLVFEHSVDILLTHPYHTEFLLGLFTHLWYPDDLIYYYHGFHTGLSVFVVRSGELGGTGAINSDTRPAQHIGYQQMKWIVRQQQIANQLNGRVIWQIVSTDDL